MIELWNGVILDPLLNSLIALSNVLFGNFGLAIIFLTIFVRLILLPLTLRQLRSTKAMSALQPKLQELQKKYARDKEKLQREVAKLYKEGGINPLGCVWPMLIQMPIWIALYQSIIRALAATPENLLDLSQHLYSWSMVSRAVPLNENFLGLNLAQPDTTLILALLVGGTMWVQQKMVTAPAADPQQRSMNNMTLLMMPLMFGFLVLQFPAGLALYWVVSNIIGIAIQYFVSGGWGYLRAPSVLAPAASGEGGKVLPKPQAKPTSKRVSK